MAALPKDPRFINRIGQRYHRLLIIDFYGIRKNKKQWVCQCDCGTIIHATTGQMKSGNTKSCGCLNQELRLKHGMNDTPEYRAWHRMTQCCYNPKNPSFERYGGRGILVCERWKIVANFLVDIGLRPSSRHSLDRCDNNGHYSCGTCSECIAQGWPKNWRWALPSEQNRNTRANRMLTIDGITLCLKDWAIRKGFDYGTIRGRIQRGYTLSELFIPVDIHRTPRKPKQ